MTAMITLRDYQVDAWTEIATSLTGNNRRVLAVLPTGAGKTVVFGTLAGRAAAAGHRTLVLAHTEELVDQAARTLRTMLPGVPVGVVRAHHDQHDAHIVVATVQTLRNPVRLARIGRFQFIVIDEAHHAVARTYRGILEELGAFDDAAAWPVVLGVTATADRGDGQCLGDIFEKVVYEIGIYDLIKRGYLSDIRAKRVMLDVNLDRVQSRGGDFVDGALGTAMIDAGAPAHIAAAIREHASDRKCIVFTPTVAMAERTADAINATGIVARSVSGQTPKDERLRIIGDVRAGRVQVVTNCMVLTEGFDAPVLDCAVMARPTRSRALYQQSAGRVLRPFIGKKDALILDMVGVTTHHEIHTATSLIDALSDDAMLGDDETATEAVARVMADALVDEPIEGTLVAFDVDIFRRSDLNWVTTPMGTFVLTGARQSFVIRPGLSDESCEVFRLEKEGYATRAVRIADDVTLGMAQEIAEDAVRAVGLDATILREQAWRNDPASDKQHRMLWALGLRDRETLRQIRTKGAASDMIATLQADQAMPAASSLAQMELAS